MQHINLKIVSLVFDKNEAFKVPVAMLLNKILSDWHIITCLKCPPFAARKLRVKTWTPLF